MHAVFRKALAAISLLALLLPAGAQEPGAKTFCWQIQSGTSTGYVLGAIHFGRKDWLPMAPSIEAAFARSDYLIVEIDVTRTDPQVLRRYLVYPPPDNLRNHVTSNTYAQLVALGRQYLISEDNLAQAKPAAVVALIAGAQIARLGYDPQFGIDRYFLQKTAGRKTVLELETAESQLALMEELGEFAVRYSLAEMNRPMEAYVKPLIAAWRTGDAAALDRLLTALEQNLVAEQPEMARFFAKVYYDRNHKMADALTQCLRKPGVCFAVVGAGHLVGTNGILNLLARDPACRITQLKATP